MSAPRHTSPFSLLALQVAKFHLEAARDSCRTGGAKKMLAKIRAALKSLDGAIRHGEGVATRPVNDVLDRVRKFVADYPTPTGEPPFDACGGSEDEPIDGWCLIEVADGLFEIEPDYGCQRDHLATDDEALAFVLERAELTGDRRYIDALRWHVRDADAIARTTS